MLGFVVCGVTGCGKSTLGMGLAERLGWEFVDADDYHPAANVAKMAAGIPLEDEYRREWLQALSSRVSEGLRSQRGFVLACSALKRAYRETLLEGAPSGSVRFVYLQASPELISERLGRRPNHFMSPALISSQFETLEPPQPGEDVLIISAALSTIEQMDEIQSKKKEAYVDGCYTGGFL